MTDTDTDYIDIDAHTERLMRLFRAGTGASPIAGQILRAVHANDGLIQWGDMWRLDYDNRDAALGLLTASAEKLVPNGLPLSDSDREALWPGAVVKVQP